MERNHYFVISVHLVAIFSHSCNTFPSKYENADFDYLLFDQQWPITECIHWKGMNNTNYCTLPKSVNVFPVHGIWPTKTGTNGPNSCSSHTKFDPKLLDPILTKLKQRWYDVHGRNGYKFWAHEWQKHGTCAQVLEPFNSVLKYFNRTLDLSSTYDIYGPLSDYGILPGDGNYAVDDILAGIVKKFGKYPQIYCIMKKGETLLQSVKLCFDKTLKLIDCTSVGIGPRNCGGRKSVRYLKNLPVQ